MIKSAKNILFKFYICNTILQQNLNYVHQNARARVTCTKMHAPRWHAQKCTLQGHMHKNARFRVTCTKMHAPGSHAQKAQSSANYIHTTEKNYLYYKTVKQQYPFNKQNKQIKFHQQIFSASIDIYYILETYRVVSSLIQYFTPTLVINCYINSDNQISLHQLNNQTFTTTFWLL